MRAWLPALAAAWGGVAVEPDGGVSNLRLTAIGTGAELPSSLSEWLSTTSVAVYGDVSTAVHTNLHADADALAWRALGTCSAVIFGQIALVAVLAYCLRKPKGEAGAKPKPPPEKAAVPELVAAMAVWIVCGMVLTMFNKWLFLPSGGNFPHAITLSAWHQLAVVIVTQAVRVSPWGPQWMPAAAEHGFSAGLDLRAVVAMVMPPAVCFAGSLALGNSAIFFLSVSFAQMLRAAKPPMVFIAAYFAGLEEWNGTRAWLILAVFVGAAACSARELQFNAVGFVYQALTFLTDVARLLTLKVLVSQPNLDPYSAMSVFAPICFLSFVGPVLLLEASDLSYQQIVDLKWFLLASGLIAVALNAATTRLMKLAAPTVFALTGTVNYLITALCSIWVFSTPTSGEQLTCFIFTLVAVSAYNYHHQTGKLPSMSLFVKSASSE